ncbi:uncharacterized protein JN550_010893 [Neoarthrinium moseri]|uniref:uncharacterized protein n=1 Tax=Neoarthrinium moseri TaxID=1658444 RepID=UPI001FDB1950|nr:uncharacterized protein JN550_010893 [Neoarthrinium moseri]KAI1861363.1 hypothetical protein JN550_010893 [Neoarthrinium moseri]
MSQRGPASRPVSPPSARSPASAQLTPLDTHQPGLRGGGGPPSEDGSQETGSGSSTSGERSQLAQRSLGVRNILNPADSQPSPANPGPSVTQQRHGRGISGAAMTSQGEHRLDTSAQQAYMARGQDVSSPHRAMVRPSGETTPSTGRESPAAVHPWPVLGAPRRYATPRSPRASSFSHGPPPRTQSQQSHFSGTSLAGPGRGFVSEGPSERAPLSQSAHPLAPQLSGLGLPGVSPGSVPNLNAPPRSLSQPMIRPHPEQQSSIQGSPHHLHRPPILPSPPPYATSVPPQRSFFAHGNTHWQQSLGGQQGVRGGGFPDEVMFAAPGVEAIPVIVNTTTASKQADEKRLRNAGASARFRQRKKDKDNHREGLIEKLEAQNRELEKRIRELEQERELYAADRDRLRDVVQRTPGISELAYQGVHSPSTSVGSFAQRSPHGSVPPPPPLPMTYGTSESGSEERPSRRRRTDPQLDFISPPYTTALPPPLSYNAPLSQPGTPSTSERLPPLRLDQPNVGPSAPSEHTSGNPTGQGQSFSPFKREPYEARWATRPGGPPDQRQQ